MGGAPPHPLPDLLPLFPLPNVVLFPHMSLPLHVFEPRYRKMVLDALGSHRTIGMVLLRPGWEGDYEGRPPLFERGCAGRIAGSETLPDGRSNIVLKGLTRFRILEEHEGEPYRLASVEALPESIGEPSILKDVRRKVLAAIGRAADGPTTLVVSDLPDEVFVNGLCQSLSLDPMERQSLLDCDTISERYLRLAAIIEFRTLEQALGGTGDDRTKKVH
jgi:Lon protease-like protein